jgi:hypothetical protein
VGVPRPDRAQKDERLQEDSSGTSDDLATVEPLLRASCTHELDASRPLDEVVADLIAIASRRKTTSYAVPASRGVARAEATPRGETIGTCEGAADRRTLVT